MKKILKSLALGVAMCFGLFAFTACGGGQFSQASVNTNGHYTACEAAKVNELVNVEDLQNQNFGYKMTIKSNGTGYNLNSTFIVTVDEQGALNALGGQMIMQMSMEGMNMNTSMELYAPNDGFVYMNSNVSVPGIGSSSSKVKTNMDFDEAMHTLTNQEFNTNILQSFLENYDTESGVTLEKAEVNGQTKFHLTVDAGELAALGNFDTNIWVVFDAEGNFVGAKLEGKISTSGDFEGTVIAGSANIELNYSVEIVPFEGEIVMPGDLNTYTSEGYLS